MEKELAEYDMSVHKLYCDINDNKRDIVARYKRLIEDADNSSDDIKRYESMIEKDKNETQNLLNHFVKLEHYIKNMKQDEHNKKSIARNKRLIEREMKEIHKS